MLSSFVEAARRVRRHRHPGVECRHRLLGAGRGHRPRDVEPQHRHPGDGLFPGLAGSVPPVPAPEARRQRRLRRRRRTVSPPRPTRRPTAPPRRRRSIWPAASRSRARRPASASTPSIRTRCCAAPRSGPASGVSSARPPRSSPSTSSRSTTASARLLKLNVFPEDIAEAIYFLASDLSAKSTGNIINVDAGNADVVHAIRSAGRTAYARGGTMTSPTGSIADDHRADNEKRREGPPSRITRRSAAKLARAGIGIDAITEVAAVLRRGSRPGASAPAARVSRASPARGSPATSSTSSTIAR